MKWHSSVYVNEKESNCLKFPNWPLRITPATVHVSICSDLAAVTQCFLPKNGARIGQLHGVSLFLLFPSTNRLTGGSRWHSTCSTAKLEDWSVIDLEEKCRTTANTLK